MCLMLLALDVVPDRPWLLLGNRDEFHSRPSAPAQEWSDAAGVFGGRDLQAGGSWLAVQRSGRYAAVTNVRQGGPATAPHSRGILVRDFVTGNAGVTPYANAVASARSGYGPFNLLVGDASSACFVSSIDGAVRPLRPGVHAFSNGSLDDQWPKMRRLHDNFFILLQNGGVEDTALLDLLGDAALPAHGDLPDTGIDADLERRLASIFVAPMRIRGEAYGTRASTLAYSRGGRGMILHERRFGADGHVLAESRIGF